jgi:GH15 family glucan-1,4-alpha-glucosidase
MLSTIDAIERGLTDERGMVYRYRMAEGVDGLAGEEGTFLLCTFWLAEALARSGQAQRSAGRRTGERDSLWPLALLRVAA